MNFKNSNEKLLHKKWNFSLYDKKFVNLENSSKIHYVCLHYSYKLDHFGRENTISLNGNPIIDLNYDSLSRVNGIKFGNNNLFFDFDEVTQKIRGKQIGNFTNTWNFNDRGMVEEEIFKNEDLGEKRNYQYNDNGYLETATTNQGSYHYGYGLDSILNQIDSNHNSLNVVENKGDPQDRSWQLKNVNYRLDESGRVIEKQSSKQKLVFGYGPQGRITQVLSGPMLPIDYSYDESGRRLVKRKGNKIDEVYLGDLLITADNIYLRVTVNNHLIGYIDSKHFHPLITDQRSTVANDLASKDINLPEPYGERKNKFTNKSQVALVDYAMVGYDSDIGLYRMDFRDYDPEVKRFLTPDPFFLERPEKCIESPDECNLYGYAKNNPIRFTDPNGTCAEPISGTACAVAAAPIAAEIIGSAVMSAYTLYQFVMSTNENNNGMARGVITSPGVAPPRQDDTSAERHQYETRTGKYSFLNLNLESSAKIANTIKVIGRLDDTATAKDWANHDILDVLIWDKSYVNDSWVNHGILNRQIFYTASPETESNLINQSGKYKGQPTIFGFELMQLKDAGYYKSGDYYLPQN